MSGQNTPIPGGQQGQQPAGPQDPIAQAIVAMANAVTQMSADIRQLSVDIRALATQPQPAPAPAPTVNATVNATTREIAFVEKPVPFRGKSAEAAKHFRSAYTLYANGYTDRYGARDAQGNFQRDANGNILIDSKKWILGALSFMQDDAAEWARPHLEAAADGQMIFNNTRVEFWKQFKNRFEPANEKADAMNKLQACTQGDRRFAEFFAEFQALASSSGLSDLDLAARLRSKFSEDYLRRISYIIVPATGKGPETYAELQEAGYTVDRSMDTLLQDLATRQTSTGKARATPSAPIRVFRDPDAMEIDAASIDEAFKGLRGNDLRKQFDSVMRDRCRVCGSKEHKANDARHRDPVCHHCQRKGHWAVVCRSRIEGLPPTAPSPTANIRANDAASSDSSPGSSTGPDTREADLAALKDSVALIVKQLASFH
ncbi:hypothetical protein PsYK624_172600 [Phanerochaete sordida]|uniref:CCHC-type domain-containing protein n=1 Tax=Phanerochaete sordida TaxID=48140 RepID=A0A9P3GS98_9APHY|nr:hypothetical protein PsYK624_172600 [Phanerochaete sordida]